MCGVQRFMRLCSVQGVTHILISKTQKGLKRQSLCFTTKRNLGWALRKSIKQQIFYSFLFTGPVYLDFFLNLCFMLNTSSIQQRGGGGLKRVWPGQWPGDNECDPCFYFNLLFREPYGLNCFPYRRALGEIQPCKERMWSFLAAFPLETDVGRWLEGSSWIWILVISVNMKTLMANLSCGIYQED